MPAILSHNGEILADIVSIAPVTLSEDPLPYGDLFEGDLSFSFELPFNEENERVFNYLMTVPEEWDLFIRQCLEKYPLP